MMVVSLFTVQSCQKDDMSKSSPVVNLTCNVTSTNVTTNGGHDGTITVTVLTGNGDYIYTISGTLSKTNLTGLFTELTAGVYHVKVEDAEGKTFLKDVTLTEPVSELTVTTTQTNVTTYGGSDGSITVTATGGVGGYTFSKDGTTFQPSNIFNGLTIGTYNITVKSGTATKTVSNIVITQPQPPQLNVTENHTNVICIGGSNGTITITATGGVGGYTFSKDGTTFQSSNVFNNLSVGTYTITVKSGTDTKTISNIVITEPSPLTLTSTFTNPTVSGGNGQIILTASGGTSPYTYQLNTNNFQTSNTFNVPAGTYTPTVKDGCSITKTISNVILTNPVAIGDEMFGGIVYKINNNILYIVQKTDYYTSRTTWSNAPASPQSDWYVPTYTEMQNLNSIINSNTNVSSKITLLTSTIPYWVNNSDPNSTIKFGWFYSSTPNDPISYHDITNTTGKFRLIRQFTK